MAVGSYHTRDDEDDTIALRRCPGLYIKLDTPKGRGVFTSRNITSGTIIDICSVLVLDPWENTEHIEKTGLYHYTYNWPLIPPEGKQTGKTQAVVFGLGSMFNHSTLAQNVGWTRDLEKQVISYRALRGIEAGEELCISYGDHLTFEDADKPDVDGMSEGDESEHLDRIQLDT